MRVGLELTGDTAAAVTFDGIAARAATLSVTAFPAIAADFHAMEAARWDADGPGWAPLSPATVAIKEAAGLPRPAKILYGQGALLNSLTGFTQDTVYDATPERLVVGTRLPYARYHQTGPRQIRVFGRGSATLPQRKLVELSPADAARWGAIIAAALRGGGR